MDDITSVIRSFNGLLIFILEGQEFCLNLKDVSAIFKPEEIDRYYDTYASQYTSVRQFNDAFPVIDTEKFLGYRQGEKTFETRVILITSENLVCTLYVGKVKEVITLVKKDGENVLQYLPSEDNPFILGKIKYEDQQWLLPDIRKICSEIFPD